MANGLAPDTIKFLAASATVIFPPSIGSLKIYFELQSVDIATALPLNSPFSLP